MSTETREYLRAALALLLITIVREQGIIGIAAQTIGFGIVVFAYAFSSAKEYL